MTGRACIEWFDIALAEYLHASKDEHVLFMRQGFVWVSPGRLQKRQKEQHQSLKPIQAPRQYKRVRSNLVPPSPTYETPDETASSRSSSSDDHLGHHDDLEHEHKASHLQQTSMSGCACFPFVVSS